MRIGELFAGYGGLGMGVKAALGGDVEVTWVSEIDPGACKVLAHRFPDAPNIGDITAVDWSQVEPVDVLTGGFPCQDVSTAGKRAGMKPGTRSGLWEHFSYAIDQLRPALVVAENVRGLLSAEAHSDVEPCPWCVGDDPASAMRALGAVLADLADLGYDAQWCGLRAADVGGCHGRFRVFVVAHPAGHPWRLDDGDGGSAPDAERSGRERGEAQLGGTSGHVAGDGSALAGALLPTPRATDGTHGGPNQRGSSGDLMLPSAVAKLLPTPAVNDMGAGKTPEEWDAWTDRMKAEHGNGNGHGASLSIEAMRLLPTPTTDPQTGNGHARNLGGEARLLPTPGVADAMGGHHSRSGDRSDELLLKGIAHHDRWGDYADAIARWEYVLGRPAPSPTETSPKTGRPRLSPRFEEWMMGLPDGWITDTPDVTWQEAVRMCGNGVVPQQAEAAVRWLLTLDHLARETS